MYPIDSVIDNRYLVKGVLGQGAMGVVYSTIESSLNRKVAVKVLHSKLSDDAEMLTRFEREAQVLSKLAHRNIVSVYRMGQWNDSFYVAMEHLEGESLEALLRKSEKLSTEKTLELVAEIATGMYAAHNAGIVHRDLKTANIFLTNDGVKILDFGLCRTGKSDEEVQKLTATGILIGSVNYMSPEACSGLPATPLSDIYSLGVILFECITGSPPFSSDSPIGTLYLHKHQAIPPIKPADSPFSLQLNKLLSKCMAKDPSCRHQTMEEFQNAVLQVLSGSETGKNSHKAILLTGITVLALVGIVSFVVLGKLNLKRTSELKKSPLSTKKAVNMSPLSALACKPIIDRAWELVDQSTSARGIAHLDQYLQSPKLKPRARILIQQQKALMLGKEERLNLNSENFKLATKEIQKGDDTDSNLLYFSTGSAFARSLLEVDKAAECKEVLEKLAKTERNVGYGGSRLAGTAGNITIHDLRMLEAEADIKLNDTAAANRIADSIVADGFGDLYKSTATANLFLTLNRDKDVEGLISSMSTCSDIPFHEYNNIIVINRLLDTAIAARDLRKWKLSKLALDRAYEVEHLDSNGKIGGYWQIGVENVNLLYQQNSKEEADKLLLKLADEWLRLNKTKPQDEYALHNPLSLIITLLAHGFNAQADQIISISQENLDRYAPKLMFPLRRGSKNFVYDKHFLLTLLAPYKEDPTVHKFMKKIEQE